MVAYFYGAVFGAGIVSIAGIAGKQPSHYLLRCILQAEYASVAMIVMSIGAGVAYRNTWLCAEIV